MCEKEFYFCMQILGAVSIVINGICLFFFIWPFIKEKKRFSGKRQLVKAAAVFVIYPVIYGANLMVDALPEWFCIIAAILLYIGVSKLLWEKKETLVCFLAVLYFCIQNLSFLMVESLSSELFDRSAAKQVQQAVILRNTALNYGMIMMLRICLMCVMLYFIQLLLRRCSWEIQRRELFYLLLIPSVGVLLGSIIIRMLNIVRQNSHFAFYPQYAIFLWVIPCIAIFVYAGILVTIILWQNLMKLQEERRNYFVREQQMESIHRRMEAVEHFYDGIRQMKHEMRNHMTNIKGLAGSGNYEEIEYYISRMDASIGALEYTIQTGNPVTDIILNDKKKSADKKQICFQSDFYFPKGGYNAYDIGIILNNLLQNALEACEGQAPEDCFIIVSARQKKKFFLLEVRNSFSGELIWNPENGLPESTKENDKSLHGFGLRNVKQESEKYMGDLEIKVNKREFCAKVILQEIKQNE